MLFEKCQSLREKRNILLLAHKLLGLIDAKTFTCFRLLLFLGEFEIASDWEFLVLFELFSQGVSIWFFADEPFSSIWPLAG